MQIYYKSAHDKEFQVLSEPREGCWIHFDEATQEDLELLAKFTSLDPIDLQDCLDKHEVPRLERIKHNVLIITRHPSDQEIGLYTSTLTMIICPHYFISVSPQKSPLVRNYLTQMSKLSTHQKAKLLIYLLLKITQDFTLQVKRVRYNVLKQEREIAQVTSEDIIALTKNEDILNQYLSTLIPMRGVLESITSGKYVPLHEKDQELIEDLLNASKQSEILCNVNLKSIRSLRNSFQIIFTNNVTKTIKLLTALTIIFSIPTVVASIYGMNVPLPLAGTPHAFLYVMSMVGALFVLSIFYFLRKGWL
ncbi:MAG: magnesium transporter CorA family protein [Simkania sp.]|nr:magnesium transporter CorA family protein [Simkania sp.]